MIRIIFCGFTIAVGISVLPAQELQQITSVEEAISLALEKNPDLEVYELQVDQSRIEMKAAKLHRLPTISAAFSGQNNRSLATTPLPGEIFGQPGEVVNAQFGQPFNYNAGITISKSLFDRGNKVQAKLERSEYELQTANMDAYQQNLIYQTAMYYYALVVTNKAADLSRMDVALTDSIVMIAEQKRMQGLIGESSVIQARILANHARENLSSTIARQVEYELQLKQLLGQPISSTLKLDDDISSTSIEGVNTQLGYDHELLGYEIETAIADLRVKKQKAAFLPKITLDNYWGQQQFREEFGLSMAADDWTPYSYVGLSLYVPLFTGLKNHHQLKSAQIAQQTAQRRQALQQQASSFQDKMLLQHFIASKDRVALAEESFELNQHNAKLSLQQYEEGLISLDTYLSIVDELLNSEQHYLNALNTLYNYYAIILSRKD